MEFCLVLGMEFHGMFSMEFHGKHFPLNSMKNAVSMEFHGIIGIISMKNLFHGMYKKWSFHGIPWKTSS